MWGDMDRSSKNRCNDINSNNCAPNVDITVATTTITTSFTTTTTNTNDNNNISSICNNSEARDRDGSLIISNSKLY